MSSLSTGDIAVVTIQTLGAYILLCVIGGTLSKRPIKDPLIPAFILQPLGKLAMNVLLPALLFTTLGRNLSITILKQSYPIFFWSLCSQLIGYILSLVLMLCTHVPKKASRVFSMAMTYGNSGSLPLVMVETLSRQPPLSDDEESLQKLTTYIFMYLTAWFLSFWSIGLLYMRNGWEIGENIKDQDVVLSPNSDTLIEPISSESERPSEEGTEHGNIEKATCLSRTLLSFCNPLMAAVILGILVGLVAPIQSALFSPDAELKFLSSALESLGKPAIGIIVLLMSASIGGFIDKIKDFREKQQKTKFIGDEQNFQMEKPSNEVSNVFWDSKFLADGSDSLDDKTVHIVADEKTNNEKERDGKETLLSMKSLVVLALGRCILLPGIILSLVLLFTDSIMPASADLELIKLVLAIQAATPSAETTIVICHQYGYNGVAESLAASYVIQYILGMIPMALAIGLSMRTLEDSILVETVENTTFSCM